MFSAVDSTIAHNKLAHIPYTAITFVWPVPQSDSFNRNLSMVSNDVSDPSYWGGDGGAVHTLAECRDCELRGNYFHDQRHGETEPNIQSGTYSQEHTAIQLVSLTLLFSTLSLCTMLVSLTHLTDSSC